MSISEGAESTSVVGEGESCHLKSLRTRFINGELTIREVIIELSILPNSVFVATLKWRTDEN